MNKPFLGLLDLQEQGIVLQIIVLDVVFVAVQNLLDDLLTFYTSHTESCLSK